jgi:hypothetical protein
MSPLQRTRAFMAQGEHARRERAAYQALPLRQVIPSQDIKTASTKAEWEAAMSELETLNHPQMRAQWEKESLKIPNCPGGYEPRTRELQLLGTTRVTLMWVHSEARRIAAELLNAEIPGEKAPDTSIYSAPFMALVAAEMEAPRVARDAKDAAAAADAVLVEKEAQGRFKGRPPPASPLTPDQIQRYSRMGVHFYSCLKIGPLFEALVVARVAELRAAERAVVEESLRRKAEAKQREEEAAILAEAKRRLAIEAKMEELRRAAAAGGV